MKKIFFLPFFLSSVSFASTYSFDPSLIDGNVSNSLLLKEGYFPPGKYFVSIELNGNLVNRSDIVFSDLGDGELSPCLTRKDLLLIGIKPGTYDGDFLNGCLNSRPAKQFSFSFNFYDRVLSLYVPDKYIENNSSEIAPESMWDNGVNAFLLNYQAIANETKNKKEHSSQNSQYIQLNPSLNIGPWRLRNLTNWSKNENTKGRWDSSYTYAERAINRIKSKILIGESYTQSDIFDSTPFNGIMLSSDENMIPLSQREFIPVVRGIADSVSTVEVLQHGYVISKKVVPAGSFEITDLPYTGGGDLNVIVTGSNGAKQFFTVPNTAPAIALHEGYLKYDFMLGKHRGGGNGQFSQFTIMYGFPMNITGFSGYQFANNYKSVAVGIGTMLGDLGAVSASVISANTGKLNNKSKNHNSVILKYNKGFEYGTYMSMSARRNGKNGFVNLDTALSDYNLQKENINEKYRYSMSVGQNLLGMGNLSINGDWSGHRDDKEKSFSYGVTFNTLLFNKVNLGIGTSKNNIIQKSGTNRNEELYNLWISMPIGDNGYNVSYQMSKNDGALNNEVGISGKSVNNQLDWNIRKGYTAGSSESQNSTGSVFLNYAGRSGTISGNYSNNNNNKFYSGGVSGSVVIYKNGIVMGQQQGDTIAIVDTKNIDNASVGNWPGVTTDYSGKAISGYLTPYTENLISINPLTLKRNSTIKINTLKVVPTEGAIVMAKFNSHTGSSLLVRLKNQDGSSLPFGSMAIVNDGENNEPVTGIVNENSTLYLSGVPSNGIINIATGRDKSCKVSYSVTNMKPQNDIFNIDAVCK